MTNLPYRIGLKQKRIDFKEFIILFITVTLLAIFAIERFSLARKMSTKAKAKQNVAKIIQLEKEYRREHNKYGSLSEIGFANPFNDNSVIFMISFQNGFIIQAKENPLFDSYGDKIPGNEYFLGYASGSIEYNRKY